MASWSKKKKIRLRALYGRPQQPSGRRGEPYPNTPRSSIPQSGESSSRHHKTSILSPDCHEVSDAFPLGNRHNKI